jgi:hypothetical protein
MRFVSAPPQGLSRSGRPGPYPLRRMIKRLLKVVELTVPEQRVVIFAVSALLAFFALQTLLRRDDTPPTAAQVDQPSPSPGMRP